jgi:hypothetical protein
MKESRNIEAVRTMYSAFGRSDIAGVLGGMDEAIVFIVPGSSIIPMAGTRRGLEEVRRFFEDLDRRVEFSVFEPKEYIAQGNRVITLVRYEGRFRSTGRNFVAEAAMLWTIGNGKAIRFQEYTDTEALATAAQPASSRALGAN